jgi:hypothetical protein
MLLRTAVLSLVVCASLVHADPLADLEVARSQANAHFRAADARIPEVTASLAQATESFRACQNGALQFQFSGALEQLERSRRALEKSRRKTQALRKSLEAVRVQLEAAHRRRNNPTHQEAVTAAQIYAERLRAEYVQPLDEALVPLIHAYADGMAGYAQVLGQYGAFCSQPGYTPAGGAAFVSSVEANLAALATKADQLGVATADARKKVEARAVSAK